MAEPAPRKPIRLVIPGELYGRLDRFSGRNRTRFILDAVERRVRELEQLELERSLEDGYRLRAAERLQLAEAALPLYGEILPPVEDDE